MLMPVMGIAPMGMGMLQLPMPMLVGMPEGLIGSNTFEILGFVAVGVVGISAARIVAVAMGMVEPLVAMQVAGLLPQQEQHPCSHQPGGDKELRGEGLPQHHEREQSSDERRRGKQLRLTGGPEIAQGQQIQPNRDP
jgi:hypothetical protein